MLQVDTFTEGVCREEKQPRSHLNHTLKVSANTFRENDFSAFCMGRKFDIDVKRSKIILGSSSEQ